MTFNNVRITGQALHCSLGGSLTECAEALQTGASGLARLREHPILGTRLPPVLLDCQAGWIPQRTAYFKKRYGLASNAAVAVAREAVAAAQWTRAQCQSAWIFAATSRGNVAELTPQPERRGHRAFLASNTLGSEIPAAVSIELGIRGPYHLLSNGCAASVDALGWAALAVSTGLTPRAVVVTSEFPLVPEILNAFAASGVLSQAGHPGIELGEAAAAVTVEAAAGGTQVIHYAANSDAHSPLAMEPRGSQLSMLLAAAPPPTHWIPHATGTVLCAQVESAARPTWQPDPVVHFLKPRIGHTLGASGLVELLLALHSLPATGSDGLIWLKSASSMGGHNAVVAVAT